MVFRTCDEKNCLNMSIRTQVLPLGALSDAGNADLYSDTEGDGLVDEMEGSIISEALVRRMCDTTEVDDVRRLAAELVGAVA
jgi:dTDP-D-glucose 4,6-dehydratase